MAKTKEEKAKEAEVRRLAALAKKGIEEVVVTEEYLKEHPEVEAEGAKVGDTIQVPVPPKTTDDKLDLNKEVSILKNGEYIRTYPAGMGEEVRGFLSKDGGKYVAVDPKKIVSITVSWRESVKRKDEETGRVVDTGRMASKSVVFTEKTHGKEWKKEARALAIVTPKRSCVAQLG